MILTLNAGSSSLKAALYAPGGAKGPVLRARALLDRIGAPEATLALEGEGLPGGPPRALPLPDQAAALAALLEALDAALPQMEIRAVGHRIVHGGPDRRAPVRLTPGCLRDLAAYTPLAPLHQPHNLAGVRAAIRAFPAAIQVGCFDTAFHRGKPEVNDRYALPQRYAAAGVRRYGFHGLSYAFIAAELSRRDPALLAGRVVVLHLGSGASGCALQAGRSVATTMGFSPLDGLVMGTRPGRLDPGVILYMLEQEGLGARDIARILYRESGLLGLSGLSADMRVLEASRAPAAAEAIAVFCARAREEVAMLAAAMGGIDGLVFTGGIGAHSARVRAQIAGGLGFLGLHLDAAANAAAAGAARIGGPAPLWSLPTDEERVIAEATARVLDPDARRPGPSP